ncbi:MAG: glycosyltransferase family 4 protein [Terracidiphilus sp.]|jgi:glycosyltransferase involved in cell wall biosynthesis
MRVLHILNDVTDRGNGIVNTAVDLAIEQARQGFVVAMVSAGGGYKPVLERAGIFHFTLIQSKHPYRAFRSLLQLRRQILGFRPDVVHAHMRTGLLLAWFWARFYRFALIGHVHNVHDPESVLMGLADRVIAVSCSVAATMAHRGIARSKIRVVLNRTLGNRRCPGLNEVIPAVLAKPSIVSVCGMSHRKGIEELLEAFEIVGKKYQSAHLYLVGDGPQRQLFEEQAHRSQWRDRIHFEGFRPVPQAYLLSADIFVLASRRESFGLVLIEAREAGCAIIATDVDGVAEALDGGAAGLLVPTGSVRALAEALSNLLGCEAERNTWSIKAREGIEMYRIQRMASDIRAVYEELLSTGDWRTAPDAAPER